MVTHLMKEILSTQVEHQKQLVMLREEVRRLQRRLGDKEWPVEEWELGFGISNFN